jgi:hypothetical protein
MRRTSVHAISFDSSSSVHVAGDNTVPLASSNSIPSMQLCGFPVNRHLLITTPRRVLAWDGQRLHTIFASTKGGITAATAVHDGSGMLAVASRDAIIMHDTQHGREQSWGLGGDEVCFIESIMV